MRSVLIELVDVTCIYWVLWDRHQIARRDRRHRRLYPLLMFRTSGARGSSDQADGITSGPKTDWLNVCKVKEGDDPWE